LCHATDENTERDTLFGGNDAKPRVRTPQEIMTQYKFGGVIPFIELTPVYSLILIFLFFILVYFLSRMPP